MKRYQRGEIEVMRLEAFFAKPVSAFGQMCDGHNLPARAVRETNVREILDFARKVKDAGGVFYMQGNQYEYRSFPSGFECIEQRNYINPVHARRMLERGRKDAKPAQGLSPMPEHGRTGAGVALRSGAAPAPAGPEDFTC